MINPKQYEIDIKRGIELLELCQRLQSQLDAVNRPEPHVIDKTKELDSFAQDISKSIVYMSSLLKYIPMGIKLAELGRELERAGKIKVEFGDDYSSAALNYIIKNKMTFTI